MHLSLSCILVFFNNILDLLCLYNTQFSNVQEKYCTKRTTYRIGLYKHISCNQYIISVVNCLVCSKQIDWVNHSIGQHHPTFFCLSTSFTFIQPSLKRGQTQSYNERLQTSVLISKIKTLILIMLSYTEAKRIINNFAKKKERFANSFSFCERKSCLNLKTRRRLNDNNVKSSINTNNYINRIHIYIFLYIKTTIFHLRNKRQINMRRRKF